MTTEFMLTTDNSILRKTALTAQSDHRFSPQEGARTDTAGKQQKLGEPTIGKQKLGNSGMGSCWDTLMNCAKD